MSDIYATLKKALKNETSGLTADDAGIDSTQTIEEEAQRLARVAMGLLAKHTLAAYKQDEVKRYHRTYGTYNAVFNYGIKVDSNIDISGGTITVTCELGDSMLHSSLFSDRSDVDALALMDRGYTWKRAPKRGHIPYFTKRPAGNIIANTLREFKSVSTPLKGIRLEIHIGD